MPTRVVVNVLTGESSVVPLSQEEIEQRNAEANEPVPARRFAPLDFLDLFTEDEQIAVITAGYSSAVVKRWYDRVLAATYITLDDPRVEAGLGALTAAGLLSEERKLAVLAAMEAE